MKLMLDTNVLLEVCAAGRYADAKEWFRRLLLASPPPELLVSVVAEYELRHALNAKGATNSLEHFGAMSASLRFVPLSAEVARQAVSLSSMTRLSDADAIIAAQAVAEGAILVTADRVFFDAVQGLDARRWQDIDPDALVGGGPGAPQSPGG